VFVRVATYATLDIADAASAHAGSLSQLLLRKSGGGAATSNKVAERGG
jgi:hypothetical protein